MGIVTSRRFVMGLGLGLIVLAVASFYGSSRVAALVFCPESVTINIPFPYQCNPLYYGPIRSIPPPVASPTSPTSDTTTGATASPTQPVNGSDTNNTTGNTATNSPPAGSSLIQSSSSTSLQSTGQAAVMINNQTKNTGSATSGTSSLPNIKVVTKHHHRNWFEQLLNDLHL